MKFDDIIFSDNINEILQYVCLCSDKISANELDFIAKNIIKANKAGVAKQQIININSNFTRLKDILDKANISSSTEKQSVLEVKEEIDLTKNQFLAKVLYMLTTNSIEQVYDWCNNPQIGYDKVLDAIIELKHSYNDKKMFNAAKQMDSKLKALISYKSLADKSEFGF